MADLSRQLAAKDKELNDLKASFDEYMASSKELELELETSLDDAENRFSSAMKQNKLYEARISDLNSKITASNKEKEKLHATVATMKANADKASITIKSLEISNDDLKDKVRMLEFSAKDLTLKLEDTEEALIILRETADTGENGNEMRLKAELTELQAELAKADMELAEYKKKENEHFKREKELTRKLSKGAYYEEEFTKAQNLIGTLETKLQRSLQDVSDMEMELADMRLNAAATGHSISGGVVGEEKGSKAKRRLSARSAAAVTKGNEVVESFESVVEDLYERLGDAEEENRELLEALEVAQDDLMRNHQAQVQAIQAAAEMEVKLKKAEDRVDGLESKLIEKDGALEDMSKSVDILKNRLEQKGVEMKEVEKVWDRKMKDSIKDVERKRVENDMLKQQMRALEMGNLKINTEDGGEAGVEQLESRLADVVVEFKKCTGEWARERSDLFEDRASLLQEIDDLRAIRGMEKFEFVSALPLVENVPTREEMPDLIDTSGRARIAAEQAIASNDLDLLKSELLHQLDRYEQLRGNNAKLLHNLQTAKGNIQVCCRARPPNDQELGQGAGICLNVVDDGEIACFDRRGMQWRSFTFDKVWDEDASQADVFADIEPLALSVVDGYNACIFAYGQTGSGKTFTMNGYGTDYGVSYRTLHQMFELLNMKKTRAENMESRKQTACRRNKRGRTLVSSGSGNQSQQRTTLTTARSINEIVDKEENVDEHSAPDSIGQTYDCERSAQDDDVSSSIISHGSGKMASPPPPRRESSSVAQSSPFDHTKNSSGSKKGDTSVSSSKTNGSALSPTPTDASTVDHTFQFSYSVEVSMLEIYNESVHDLLVPQLKGVPGESTSNLDIRHDADGTVNVPGLIKESVSNLEEVMEVFKRGSANRATTATSLNEHSSRSHSILIVYITTTTNNGLPVTGKLYLVDLAGSERLGKSVVSGQAMKETQHINKSLSALGDVMEGLDKKSKHIPFRNSKLTYLLQDSLGGNSRTMMIVTVCPTELSGDETLFALQFATRARNIQLGTAKRNVSVKGMEEAVKQMRHELKEERKKCAHLQDIITDMRRESRQKHDKISHQMDTKIRSIDETRKGAELQIEVLTRTNAELIARLQEEKEQHRLVVADWEKTQKSLKKIDEQLRTMSRDKDRAYATLQVRDKENEGLRNLVKSLKDPSGASDTTQTTRGNSKTPVQLSTPSAGTGVKSTRFLAQTQSHTHPKSSSGRKSSLPVNTPASRTKSNRSKTTPSGTIRLSLPTSTARVSRSGDDDDENKFDNNAAANGGDGDGGNAAAGSGEGAADDIGGGDGAGAGAAGSGDGPADEVDGAGSGDGGDDDAGAASGGDFDGDAGAGGGMGDENGDVLPATIADTYEERPARNGDVEAAGTALGEVDVTIPSYLKPTNASRRLHTPEGGDRQGHQPSSRIITAGGGGGGGSGFKKETVTAMATSRAQEAMLRHQERMKKRRETRGSFGRDRAMHF